MRPTRPVDALPKQPGQPRSSGRSKRPKASDRGPSDAGLASQSRCSTRSFTIVKVWVMRPANYFKKRPAWVIEWETYREDSPIRGLRPHILPWRWRSEKVADYMRCMYWNSSLWTPFETFVRVNKRKPDGVFIECSSTPFLYGDGAACLVASYVKDLHIERDDVGKITMEWTRPPRYRYDSAKGRAMPVGPCIKRKFVCNG